jgi:hypothetical protein
MLYSSNQFWQAQYIKFIGSNPQMVHLSCAVYIMSQWYGFTMGQEHELWYTITCTTKKKVKDYLRISSEQMNWYG